MGKKDEGDVNIYFICEQIDIYTTHFLRVIILEYKEELDMLTKKELEIIEEYVDEEFYDKEKLIKYLSIHDCCFSD